MAEEKFEDKTLRKKEEIKIKEGEAEKKEEKAKEEEKKAPAGKKEEKKEEKKTEIVLERKYTANLSRAYAKPKTKKANTAITLLKEFCVRHMKGKSASIEPKLNDVIRAAGRPLKKVSVLLQKDKEGVVYAKLAQ
ncbi:hypothetical protein HZC09_02025 [Candidatus Micrarchaeota archaeon]|nr:hypothetical protein [Candidatus Micrarchaeota archaeon]